MCVGGLKSRQTHTIVFHYSIFVMIITRAQSTLAGNGSYTVCLALARLYASRSDEPPRATAALGKVYPAIFYW